MKKAIGVSLAAISLFGLLYLLKTGDKMKTGMESSIIPQRIISLGPPITESLYLVGAEDRLIANTTYCNRPKEAQNKEKVGSTMRVSLEKIIALEPDLILATSLSNPKQIQKLRGLGIEVACFPDPTSFSGLCEGFLRLGKIVGQEKEAEKILEQVKEKTLPIQQRTKDLPKPKVLVQIGARPLWVAPKDSFINDLVQMAGGINIGPSGKSGLYSLEEVLKENPDVIIITEMGIMGKSVKTGSP